MNETKATRYQRLKRRARAAEAVSAGLVLAVLAFTPASAWLSRAAHAAVSGLSGRTESAAALIVFVTAMVLLTEAAALPASLYLALGVDSRYRRAPPQAPEQVFAAHATGLLVLLPSALLIGTVVAVSTALAGAWWWVMAGPLLAAAAIAALHVAPAVLARVADVRPLGRADLAHRVADVARRAGAPVAGIAEWRVEEGHGATALVSGTGRGRRVLLAADVVREWTVDEVAVVVAHELGHVVHADLWRTLLLNVILLWLSVLAAHLAVVLTAGRLGATPADLSALPLMTFVGLAVWMATTPLRHAQSRAHERRADRFALELTQRVDAFGATLRRLGERHLAEDRPSRWTRWFYHRHPSIAERLAAAEAFREQRAAGRS